MTDSFNKEAAGVLSKALDLLPPEVVTIALVCVTISVTAWATHDGSNTVIIALIITIFALLALIIRFKGKATEDKRNLDSMLTKEVTKRLSAFPDISSLPCVLHSQGGASAGGGLPPINHD